VRRRRRRADKRAKRQKLQTLRKHVKNFTHPVTYPGRHRRVAGRNRLDGGWLFTDGWLAGRPRAPTAPAYSSTLYCHAHVASAAWKLYRLPSVGTAVQTFLHNSCSWTVTEENVKLDKNKHDIIT